MTPPRTTPFPYTTVFRTDTASLKVDATELAKITLSPKSAEINAGGTQLYAAEGFDAHGNDLGDDTAQNYTLSLHHRLPNRHGEPEGRRHRAREDHALAEERRDQRRWHPALRRG